MDQGATNDIAPATVTRRSVARLAGGLAAKSRELVGLAALVAVLTMPGLLRGPTLDATVFLTVAQRIAAGATAYRDVWDHKPPGLYLLEAPLIGVLHGIDPWLLGWTLTIVAITGASLASAAIARRMIGVRAAPSAGILCAIGLSIDPISFGGGHTETFAAASATICLLSAMSNDHRSGRIMSGIAMGVACSFSFLGVSVVAPLAWIVFRAASGACPGRSRTASVAILAVALGCGIVVAVVFLVLLTTGAPPFAMDAVVRYNQAYSALNRDHLFVSIVQLVESLAARSILIVPALALRRHDGLVTPFTLLWLLGGAGAFVVAARIEPHYLSIVVPPLAIAASASLRRLPSIGARSLVGGGAAATSVVLIVWLAQASGTGVGSRGQILGASRWLDSLPAGPIYVWGNEPGLYLYSGRPSAGPYIYAFPLITPGYSNVHQISLLLDQWRDRPPVAVVDASRLTPHLLIPGSVYIGDGRALDILDPLRAFVATNYQRKETIDGYTVYLPSQKP
jgi:hypothetical protein